jgi:hypothetical protein
MHRYTHTRHRSNAFRGSLVVLSSYTPPLKPFHSHTYVEAQSTSCSGHTIRSTATLPRPRPAMELDQQFRPHTLFLSIATPLLSRLGLYPVLGDLIPPG